MTAIARTGFITQLAYVPVDFDKALKYWTQVIGIGPFFLRDHVPLEHLLYRGETTKIDMTMALSYWGDIQIELIRQNDDTPSVYNGAEAVRGGVHHICIEADDITEARQRFEARGSVIVQEGAASGGIQFFYADSGDEGGVLTEVISLTPQAKNWFASIKQEVDAWDGSDPVRNMIER